MLCSLIFYIYNSKFITWFLFAVFVVAAVERSVLLYILLRVPVSFLLSFDDAVPVVPE